VGDTSLKGPPYVPDGLLNAERIFAI
jgi:hypothetical protein